jgi:hypothetical protein
MLIKAAGKSYITGLMSTLCPKSVINLQYANDTLLFFKKYPHATCHLKWLMVCFEKLSGMTINFHKSDMTPSIWEKMWPNNLQKKFCGTVGSFPFRYLGVPLHYEKLKREDL